MQRRFSIDEIKIPAKEPVLDKAGFLAETFYKVHCEKINSIKNLITRLPDIGEIFLLSTLNSFNAFTFVPFIIKNCGVIDELIITTYSINIRIIDALIKQIDLGNIRKVDLLISYSLKARLPKVYDHLSALETNRKNVTVNYSWNHSKVTLIRSQHNYYIVEGSGNFSENAQFEQYIFLNNETVYRFRKEAFRN